MMRRRFALPSLLVLLLMLAVPALAQDGALLTLTDLTLQPGETGTVEARLSCTPQCGVVTLSMSVDPLIIRIDGITPGSALGELSLGESAVLERTVQSDGVFNYSAVSIGNPSPQTDLLFTLDVTAVGAGFTQLAPRALAFGDLSAQSAFGSINGGSITVTGDAPPATATPADNTSIEPSPTAEPTAQATATAEPVVQTGDCLVQSLGSASIHVGPSFDRTIRGSLGLNVQVLVTGQTTDEDGQIWWRIQPENFLATEPDRYWVPNSQVQTIGDCASVPQVEGSAVIAGGAGGGTTFSHTFSPGERSFTHTVRLGQPGIYRMTCQGTPLYPGFVFNTTPSNGQTSVTISASGNVPLVVSRTVVNAGQTREVASYTCTLSRQ
jgi:hypothetical protein